MTFVPARNFTISLADHVRAAAGPPAYALRRRRIEDLEATLVKLLGVLHRKTGDEVKAGEVIARIQLGNRQPDADELRQRYLSFVQFGDTRPEAKPLVHEYLT